MELEPIDELFIKRKVYVATVGWIVGILSGLMVYFTIIKLINYFLVTQSKEMKSIFNLIGERQTEINSLNTNILIIITCIGFLGIFFLLSSIGLISYRKWARKIFVTSSWIFIGISLFGLLLYILLFSWFTSGIFASKIIETFGNDVIEVFKLSFRISALSYSILLVFVIRVLFRICLKFNKVEYKRLFI